MKKLISVFLTICMLAGLCTTFTVSTSADSPVYYEAFQLGEDFWQSDAKEYAQEDDYILIDYDLNTGNWGTYCIFLAYKTTSNPNNAITDMVARIGRNKDSETWVNPKNGCTYNVIGGKDGGVKCTAIDVNDSTGGDYIYLYVTKDPKAGNPITDLNITQSYYDTLRNYYVYNAEDDDGYSYADLNSGVWSKSNYITFNRATYYSSLQLGAGDNGVLALDNVVTNSHLLLSEIDLNAGILDEFIYLGYKTTTDKSDAIRDIICVIGEEYASKDSIIYNGCTYYPVGGYYGNSDHTNDYYKALDVNKGAGGDYLYLFYTKDEKAGEPITHLTVSYSENWNTVKYINSNDPADLNKTTGGKYIYLIYKKAANAGYGSQFAGYSNIVIFVSAVVIVIGVAVGVYFTKKKRKSVAAV